MTLDERKRRNQQILESAPRASVERHEAYEPTFPPPPIVRLKAPSVDIDVHASVRDSVRPMFPWWKRAFDLSQHAPKVIAFWTALSGATVGAHLYVKGLVTQSDVDVRVATEVKRQTDALMVDAATRLTILESRTGGLGEFLSKTVEQLLDHDTRVRAVEHLAEKTDRRVDNYTMRRTR